METIVLVTGARHEDVAMPPGEWGRDRFPGRLDHAVAIDTPGSHAADVTRPAEPAAATGAAVSA